MFALYVSENHNRELTKVDSGIYKNYKEKSKNYKENLENPAQRRVGIG